MRTLDSAPLVSLKGRMELALTILMLTVAALSLVVVWLIWTTISIRGSVRGSRSGASAGSKTTRLDAELYVETYRKQRQQTIRGTNQRGR